VPLHPYTGLELLFDPALGDRFVAIEILINYVLVAAMMLAACRYLDIPGWAGCLGFLAYVLFDPVPVISHIPWWWAGAFVAGPFMILIVMMHPSHPPPRLRLVCCALALFFVTGTKPEVLYMFLLYVTLLTFVLASLQRSTPLAIGASLLTYVAVPLSFYAWQIPLVRSLLATSTVRFRASPESAFGIIENIYLSLLTSDALRIGVVTLAGVVTARFLAASAAPARSRRLAPPSFLHLPLTSVGLLLSLLVFVLGLRYLVPRVPAFGGVIAISVLWGVITARMINREIPILSSLSLHSLWRCPLLTAGSYSAIFETYGVTAARSVPGACAAGFLFFMIVGGVFRPSSGPVTRPTLDCRLAACRIH
jgi:hypothetical protein